MAQHSKYSTDRIEALMLELDQVLVAHQAPLDLSLMVLGNLTSHLLTQGSSTQNKVLTDKFVQALQAAVAANGTTPMH